MFSKILTATVAWMVLGDSTFSAELQVERTETELVGHWKLQGDCKDSSGRGNHGIGRNITFGQGPNASVPQAAIFDGRGSWIETPDAEALHLGKGDFALAVWVKPATPMQGVLGDIVSKYDPQRRRGINFHLAGSSSGYNSMCDTRHVHFGIDDGYLGSWQDCGKPWTNNSLVTCLVVFEGQLYCGIADAPDPKDAARVFRWAGGSQWVDCGRLGEDPNHLSVQSMTVHDGKLYAGTGIWDWDRARGKVPGKPPAARPHVFVYEGGTKWRDLGQVGETSRVLCMASFNGELYVGLDRVDRATSPDKCFKYAGSEWVDCGGPDSENLECLLPVGGVLYAATQGSLRLYVNGHLSASSRAAEDRIFDLSNTEPLKIGFGAQTHLAGAMADLRLYARGLDAGEVKHVSEGLAAATGTRAKRAK